VKEFTTAVERVDGDDERGFEFKVDGVLCTAYRPTESQLAVLMATTGRHSSVEEQIAGYINFFVAVLDDASHHYVVSRLLDRKNPLPIEVVQNIIEWLISEWSGRPIVRPSGSTGSPPSTGSPSTEEVPALT
jgi:hypothetical protein